MNRTDYIMLSATLRKVRNSYAPNWDANLFRACDDHAKAIADALERLTGTFNKEQFLRDSGVPKQ